MAEKEKNGIDWAVEAEVLKDKGDSQWWKSTPGQHQITFLSEGLPKTAEFEGKTLNKVQFEIEVDKKRYLWDVTKGQTKSSLFGQIALIAADLGNAGLIGTVISLVVKGNGKETSYTVLEALSLMQGKKEDE